jgi:8-oxo-dGTP diphosphatase
MDWVNWTPRERANLCFIVKEGHVLLIRKRRGFGAGKINAPGGKIEPGESPLQSAIRETQEEIGVTPLDPQKRGELHFQFADGYSLHCEVFLATELSGEPVETDEAIPLWVDAACIPYEEMWEDDRHWLPLLLEGKTFAGYFEFDGENMTSKKLEITSEFLQKGAA